MIAPMLRDIIYPLKTYVIITIIVRKQNYFHDNPHLYISKIFHYELRHKIKYKTNAITTSNKTMSIAITSLHTQQHRNNLFMREILIFKLSY